MTARRPSASSPRRRADILATDLSRHRRDQRRVPRPRRTRTTLSRHLMSNFHVLRHGSGRAEAVSALVLYAQDGTPPVPTTVPVLIADVYDRYVRSDEAHEHTSRWRIASRRIENRFLMPGDVLAVPTE
ncbi:hypothetical protein NKH77_52755 [Streptomyces sp. M19]